MNDKTLSIIIRARDEASKVLSRTADNFERAGQQMQNVGSAMTKGITLPVIGAGVAIFKASKDFDSALDKMVGLVGLAEEEVDGFAQSILKLGPAIGKSPKELADAMFFITSAGLRGQKAMEALEMSAKASAAGLGETAVVADAVTSAMNAYSKAGMTAEKATDILTAAVRMGKLEASQLAPVLGKILPTASALGVTFEDVAGVLAVFSRTGLDAAEGATSLNATLSFLARAPGKAAKEALDSVNISMKDLKKMAKGPEGIIGVMRTLGDAFEGNDEALSAVIPNVRAFRGFMNVLAQDGEIVDDVMQGVAKSVGVTNSAFKATTGDAGHKYRQSLARIQSILINLGDVVMPMVARMLDGLSGKVESAVKWWEGLATWQKEAMVKLAGFMAVVGPALFILGKLSVGVGALVKVFGLLAGAGGASTGIAGATVAAGKFGIVAKAAPLLMNPWTLAIGGAAVGLGFLAKKIWESKRNAEELDRGLEKSQRVVTDYRTQVGLTELAERRLSKAKAEHNRILEHQMELYRAKPQLQKNVELATDSLRQRQDELNRAIDKYGPESDEAWRATLRLQDAQSKLNEQLRNAASNSLSVTRSVGDLRLATKELARATHNAIRLTDGLANNSFPGLITSMGNVQVQAVRTGRTIQSSLSVAENKIYSLNGNLGYLQATSSNVTSTIMGNFGALQAEASTTARSINQIPSSGGRLRVDNNADGTRNYPGGWSWVGEEGPELMYVPKGSNIYSNPESKEMASSPVNIYGNINLGSQSAVDRFFDRLNANKEMGSYGVGI